MKPFDAMIIGGGIAGVMTGIFLRKKGWKVLIFEKSEYPRHKVCGEFLSPAIWPILKNVGLDSLLKSKNGKEIEKVRLFWPYLPTLENAFPSQLNSFSYGYGLSRKTLDSLLLSEAENCGCIVQQQEIRTIDRDKATVIIDAAGRQSQCINKSKPIPSQDKFFGFKAHFKNIKIENATELFFFKGGYIGLNEVENGFINLCGKIRSAWFKESASNLDYILESASQQNPMLRERLHHAMRETEWLSCGPLQEGFKRGYHDGIFYVGDAACFVEPLLGQGMTTAIASAHLLASSLPNIPKNSEELNQIGVKYEKALKKLYKTRVMIGNFFNPFAFSPKRAWLPVFILATFPFLFRDLIKKTFSLPQN